MINLVQEAQDRKMQLRQDDEDAVAAMIYYFYHGDDEEQVSNRSGSSANVSSKVFAVADKYIASGLRVFAVRKFTEALALLPLESEDFATTIAEGYASRGEEIDAPPNAICQGLLNFTNQNASVLFSGCPGFIRFREVTWFTPAFAADLHVIKQHVIFEPVNLSQPHNSRSQQRRTYPTERRPPYGSLHL